MSKPLDPRLVRRASAARRTIMVTIVLSIALTATVVAIAMVLAKALGDVVTGARNVTELGPDLAYLGALFIARGVFQFALTRVGHRGARGVIAELRRHVVIHISSLGPRWAAENASKTTTLLTRGLDALDPYFTSYIPQLILSAILTPALLVVMATEDLLAAVTLVIAIPLIPVFMWLIGVMTHEFASDRLAALTRLGEQLLDLVAGIPTLRAFGRAKGPASRVRTLAQKSRKTTMATLRVAFLSGAVLELISTIAVAMVAVGVGLRLVNGTFELVTGLAVLIMAPEVLLPLRQVGVQFHNSADGVAAADEALNLLEIPQPITGTTKIKQVQGVEVDSISVRAGQRNRWAPQNLSFSLTPGTITALAGPSGSGKTTAMNVVLGLLPPDEGRVLLHLPAGPIDLRQVELSTWWNQLTWVPQHPTFEPATIAETLRGDPETLDKAVKAAGLDDVVNTVGWHTPIGRGGHGLSLGQRQRLALARALLGDPPFIILDEPTAHLDSASEDVVVNSLLQARDSGKGILVIAHRQGVLNIADQIITTEAGVVR